MTDSPSLRDYFEDNYDADDYDAYLFGEENLSDVLEDVHGRIGDSRKNVSGIVNDSDFILPYESQIENDLLNDVTSIDDLRKLDKIARGNAKFRLVARSRGLEISKQRFKQGDLDEPYRFLQKYSPQTLGGLTRQELRRTEGFRALFQ